MEFFKENVLLIGLAIGSGVALLFPLLNRSAAGSTLLTVTEAVMLMSRKQVLVLDVREPDEFKQGHLQGARNIPLSQLATRVAELEKFKDKPVLLVCERGNRTRAAVKVLREKQFSALHQLKGGMQAWIEAKMPLGK
ncbi:MULTISPECIES: rhodanese-like domain-containing protein [unclassified Methylophilus]|uniref:rhodanese-like domain-containing protein n=1 Tax=unclassified Methylophilus TaxID=2630143 RepID=UPI0006F3B665|nr:MULTISPECIES: rhodanese-like domain-containing protein [unclassified Methylophilus]KQT43896.1 sulfurtransferase [Methylophilus sp. Leaf416]KQT59380.1 sulfurtransferase [Methylophilus sp. Leaf459]